MRAESPGLARTLGLWDVTTITAGTILGSAIFVAAAFVPREVPHPTLVLLLWVAGGLIAIAGALCYAELGTMFPEPVGSTTTSNKPSVRCGASFSRGPRCWQSRRDRSPTSGSLLATTSERSYRSSPPRARSRRFPWAIGPGSRTRRSSPGCRRSPCCEP
jgi:Amino acid permease